jgi:hypothetical protein
MSERMPIWATVLFCLAVLALLTLVIGGPAIGWFARWVQYLLAFVAVLALAGGAVALWVARRDGRTFGDGSRSE